MPSSYSIPRVYEDEIEAVIRAGYYSSKSDVVRDALRLLFETRSHLRLSAAIEMFTSNKITLSKAAELAGMDLVSFKEILADRGIPVEVEVDDTRKMDRRTQALKRGAEKHD